MPSNFVFYGFRKEILMKLKRFSSILLSLVITVLIISFSVITVIAYSSDEDPLITLSYLTDIVLPKFKNEITDEYKAYISSNIQEDDNLLIDNDDSKPVTKPESDVPSSTTPTNNSYTLLELTLGQRVLVQSATEIIVRPGSIVCCVSPFDEQGIADITNGKEVLDGQEIAINAYCIIPRGNDGRGFTVNSNNAYVMIRGEYTVE